ncbi:hypothetical protein L9F63_025861, partial [Diploptera punctata]
GGGRKQPPCDMCSNYEAQLVRAQQRARELEKQVATQERTVGDLKKQMKASEDTLLELRHTYTQMYEEVMDQLTSLTKDRVQVQEELDKLRAENDNLMGKHSAHSQQLQNEMINWPDKVEDLQVLLLKFHEELIAAKVAKETMEEQEQILRSELQLLRDQMSGEHEERVSMENSLILELNNLKLVSKLS